jgi:hypothetical protein
MGYATLVKKQFTVPKLSFYFIFWGIQFFLFGYGWYGVFSSSFLHRHRHLSRR